MLNPREDPLARAVWIVNTCVDQIGTVLFTLLTITTIRQKRLHSPCQLLLGLYGFVSLLSKLQILLPFFVFILPGPGTIPRIVCAFVQLIPIGGGLNVFTLMFIIGIDRMHGIFFPIWYSMKSEKNYVKKLYLISLIYPLVFVAYVIRSLIQDPFLQVQCFSQDLMGVDGRSLIVGAQLVFNLLTLTCYVLISSIEVPTIFAVSTEHRLAFKDEFSWLIKPLSSNKNSKVFILSNKNTTKSIQPQSTLIKNKTNGIVSVGY
uniref:G_PROTEIN_RECEP_F1_2 domain-containing protein n=1 Tax=Meloidogyne floridensis TaxID=298350 RepID=A0A915P798_9BILA